MEPALIVLLGVFTAALLGFFAWLAKTVMDVRERIVKIEGHLASLLETRVEAAKVVAADTQRRLDGLERGTH